nr:hypothetical protein [Demequina sediminis]
MGQDGRCGLGRDERDVLVFVDDDLGKQRTVQHAAFSRFASGVEVAEVGQDAEDLIEPVVGIAVGGRERVEAVGDRVQTGADTVLFGLEQIKWDRVGVVGLDELEAFGLQLVPLRFEELAFVVTGGFELAEHSVQHRRDVLGLGGGEAVGAVVPVDPVLDPWRQHGGAGAALLLPPAGAGEVLVPVAVLVPGPFDHELGPARAVQVAFEVVVVLLRALADGVLRVELGLHAQPGIRVHECGVGTVVGDAAEGDGALVVGVRQDLVQRRGRHRTGRLGRCGACSEPAGLQLPGERGQRLLPGGVGGKREPHQLGPLGVDLHVTDLAALGVSGAHVEVAQWRLRGGTTEGGLLDHALGDLLGEVEGVELRHRGENAVHQHPRGRLIGVLRHRDQDDVRTPQSGVDDRVIQPVAGEPVDLIDDAVPHRIRRQVVEHLLQRTPPRRLGRLARFDELLDDDRAELLGLPGGRFTLGRDGQSFFEAVTGGLVLGRDPQVGDRRHQPFGQRLVSFLGWARVACGQSAQGA